MYQNYNEFNRNVNSICIVPPKKKKITKEYTYRLTKKMSTLKNKSPCIVGTLLYSVKI